MVKRKSLDKGLLETIAGLPSPSSKESLLRDYYIDYFSGKATSVGKDVLGNASAVIAGQVGGSKIMVTAHMDEVGFVITGTTEEGFLKFAPLGAVDNTLVQGHLVDIYTPTSVVQGIVGKRPIHYVEEDDEIDKINEMFIDIGAEDEASAAKKVCAGSYAVWHSDMVQLSKNIRACRGADNKVGVYALMRALSSLIEKNILSTLNCSVFGVLTPMEEVEPTGYARAAAEKIQPGAAIVIDTTDTGDYPDSYPLSEEKGVTLSGGPVLPIDTVTNSRLVKAISEAADDLKIPLQRIITSDHTSSTTVDEISFAAGGVPCAALFIPVRYIHSPYSVFDIRVVEKTAELITYICENVMNIKSFIP